MESTKFLPHLLLSGFLAFNTAAVLADKQNLELEPAVSGGVSASGLYESQALEDTAAALKKAPAATADGDRLGNGEDDVISAFGGHRDDFAR